MAKPCSRPQPSAVSHDPDDEAIGRVLGIAKDRRPNGHDFYRRLAIEGRGPKPPMLSHAGSRVAPGHVVGVDRGDLFSRRDPGNIGPPRDKTKSGVSSTVEYAVMAPGATDIIGGGHSGSGLMKAVASPEGSAAMANVAAWLRHPQLAGRVVTDACPDMDIPDRVRSIAMKNVVAQTGHLCSRPSVAVGITRNEIALHGWSIDNHAGCGPGLDGMTGRFPTLQQDQPPPVALPHGAGSHAICTIPPPRLGIRQSRYVERASTNIMAML